MSASAFDCVVTYHQNPLTCGVAKFNHILAERLGVPVVGIFDSRLESFKTPFISVKCGEFSDPDLLRLHSLIQSLPEDMRPSLFLHGFDNTLLELELVRRVEKVYCGNRFIAEQLREHTHAVVSLWSPSTLRPLSTGQTLGEIRVFSFGMAHKLQARQYLKLRELLERTGKTYTIFLSTALHEGTAFEDAFSSAFDQLRGLFGDRIRFLGFLSDDAVLEYMDRSTFFAGFFPHGMRENNSSVIAAMERRCVVITNLDEHSPTFCRHGVSLLDIEQLDSLPHTLNELETLRENACEAVRDRGWHNLMRNLLGESRA